MARHPDPSRLGRTRPGCRCAAALGIALLLGGCVPPPKPQLLAYRFSVSRFEDARTESEDEAPAKYPFDQADFMKGLSGGMPYTLFGSEAATLDLRLKHYEATSFGDSYAISMVFEMNGKDGQQRGLAARTIMCSDVQSRGFELQDYGQQVWADKNLQSLTPEARDLKMWHRVFDDCVQELARKFGQALVESQNMHLGKPASK